MMMLTTFMVHHHHNNQICTIEEICAIDGNINDNHTSHAQNEEEGCPLLQIRNFTSNVKSVQNTYDTSISHFPCLFGIFANIIIDYNNFDSRIIDYPNKYAVLTQANNTAHSRRGPPVL
ncbi:MAG: hypothetical protein PHG06_11840 [Parabacteroides sp.]|nr:hypothetical protein [Parabacteroides sp.]